MIDDSREVKYDGFPDYLYIESNEPVKIRLRDAVPYYENGTDQFTKTIYFEYSKDRENWTPLDGEESVISPGKTYIRGIGNSRYGVIDFNGTNIYVSKTLAENEQQDIKIGGNVFTLAEGTDDEVFELSAGGSTSSNPGPLAGLFLSSDITSAINLKLPTQLSNYCYWLMFANCKYLKDSPKLLATKTNFGAYAAMFENCVSLINAPELPATVLSGGDYLSMFEGCTSLKRGPVLPATTGQTWCYNLMFGGCTNLNEATIYLTSGYDGKLSSLSMCLQRTFDGVSETGVLHCYSEIESFIRSGNIIPEGWEIKYLD